MPRSIKYQILQLIIVTFIIIPNLSLIEFGLLVLYLRIANIIQWSLAILG